MGAMWDGTERPAEEIAEIDKPEFRSLKTIIQRQNKREMALILPTHNERWHRLLDLSDLNLFCGGGRPILYACVFISSITHCRFALCVCEQYVHIYHRPCMYVYVRARRSPVLFLLRLQAIASESEVHFSQSHHDIWLNAIGLQYCIAVTTLCGRNEPASDILCFNANVPFIISRDT